MKVSNNISTIPELEEVVANHTSHYSDDGPSVYVGTYGKYNEGSLCGLWIDLSSFSDYDEISNFCKAIHADKYDNDAVDDYMEFKDSLDNFEEAYCGEWDSEEDFARHTVEEYYDIERMMGSLANYFDYEVYRRELFNWDYNMGKRTCVPPHRTSDSLLPKGPFRKERLLLY